MATGYSPPPENNSKIDCSSGLQQQSEPFCSIIQTTALPAVVKYDSSNPLDERLVTPTFDPKEPILVHSKHRVRRIRARCVQYQSESNTFIGCDCDAVIPEAYPGWFAVFGKPSTQTRDPIVPHYRRISQLAISACTKFLVAGDRPVNALLLRQGEGDQIEFHPTDIYSGTVLHKGNLFSTFPHPVKAKKWFRKKNKEKVPKDKYLSATDDNGYTFFMPCEMEGLFYVLGTETGHLPVPVLKFADIIERYRFPLLIKLVQGRIPLSSSFNGTLVLCSSDVISFAITLSIGQYKKMIFEILENSSLPFLLSAPEENESDGYKNALIYLNSLGDSFLHSIRFQNRTSDYTYLKDDTADLDSMSFSEEKYTSSKGPDISCVRIEELRLFPPSPVATKVVGDDQVPHPVVSLNLKEIKRTMTFDRPKSIQHDIIPIEKRRDSKSTTNSADEERLRSDANSSSQRPYSGSESSTLSSASHPSLQDMEVAESEEKEDLPPPPAELLQNDCVEDDNVPEDVPDESRNYYGLWTTDTLRKDSRLSTEVDVRDGVSSRSKTDSKSGDKNADCPNRPALSVCEDENGYVIASDLTVRLHEDENCRPASYISIHPPENEYDTLIYRESMCNDDNASDLVEAREQVQTRGTILNSGSHHYVSLEDVPPEGVNKHNSKYANLSCSDKEAIETRPYENISHLSKNVDQTAPSTENGQSESAHSSWKKVLQQPRESSNDKSDGYANLKDISLRGDIAASHKNRFLQKLKQHSLKKTTYNALVALNEDDFVSIVHAEDPLDMLKELIPQMSKSDVFMIGLCLKDL